MKYSSALAAVLFAVAGSAHATEYLQNGSFETGDFSGWNLADPGDFTFVEPTTFGYGAESGNFYVYAGPPSATPSVLSQTFSDTAGQELKISGWAIGDTFDLPNNLGEVSYFFDGVLLGAPDLSSGNWTQSRFQVTATGSDTFSITFSNDNSVNGLDNFSVSTGVPEPSTWILSLLGFAGLALLTRTGRRVLSRPA
jgi:PEP-CTERM motif-containing protein